MELIRAMDKFCRYSGVQKSETTTKDLYYHHMNLEIIKKFKGLKVNESDQSKEGLKWWID